MLLGTGIAISLAGCSDVADSGIDNEGSSSQAEVQLGEILLHGTDGDDSHAVQIAVEDGTGVAHLDTYSVEPGESPIFVEREWENSRSSYKINIRVDGQDRQTVDVIEQMAGGRDCVDILVLIDADGAVDVWDQSCTAEYGQEEATDDEDEETDNNGDDEDNSNDTEADDSGDVNDEGEE